MIWFVFLVALVLSFMFSGIESGVLAVNRVRLRHYARKGEEAAMQLDLLLGHTERLVTTVVLVTNAANVVAVTILYTQFTEWLGVAGAVAALVVALPVFVFGLEFLPKAIFRRFPYRTLVVFARILSAASAVLAPVVGLGAWILRPLFRAGREEVSGRIVSFEDLKRMVAESAAKGELTENERELISHAVDFRTLRVRTLMDPIRPEAKIPPEMPVADLLAKSEGGDRYLVVDDAGEVQGLIRIADLLFDDARSGRVQSYVRRVVMLPESESAMSALRKLRAARLPVAVVTNERGGSVGFVTAEQLTRRLFGGMKKSGGAR